MKKVFLFFLSMLLLITVAVINNKAQAATIEVLDHYELGSYSGSFVDVNKQRNWVLTKSGTTYRIYNYTTGSLVTSFTADEVLSRSFRDDVDAMGTNTRMYYRNGDTVYYRDKNNITVEKELFTGSYPYFSDRTSNFVASQDRIAVYYHWPSSDDEIMIYDAWNGSYIHSKTPIRDFSEIYDLALGKDGFLAITGKYQSYHNTIYYIAYYRKDALTYDMFENSSSSGMFKAYAAGDTVYSSTITGTSTKYLRVYSGYNRIFEKSSSDDSILKHIIYNDETDVIFIYWRWRPISDIDTTVGYEPKDTYPYNSSKVRLLDTNANVVFGSDIFGSFYVAFNRDFNCMFLEVDLKAMLLSSTDENKFLMYLTNGDIIYMKKTSSCVYMEKKAAMINTNFILLDYDSVKGVFWSLDTNNRKIVKVVSSQIVTEDNLTQIINDSPAINDIQNDITSINNTLVNHQNQLNAKKIAPTVSFVVANTENDVSTTRNITLKARAVKPGVSLTSSNTFQYRYSTNGGSSWTGWYNWGTSFNRNIGVTLPNVVGWHDVALEVRHYVSASEIYDGGIAKQLVGYDPNYQSNTELRNRVTELEKDKVAPIIYELDTVIENKSAVDLSSEGNSIQFLIQAQDDRATLNQMQYSYKRNNGVWSSWVSIPLNGQISVYIGSGSNIYEFKVRDNASPANESLIYKFHRTIWGL